MNWTEGSLVHHSRGRQRNALLARQKQHFAKVRNNLLNRHAEKNPIAISFLTSPSTPKSPFRSRSSQDHCDELSVPPLPKKQGFALGLPPSTRKEDYVVCTTTVDRRRRLLEKSDWAGLTLQRPLDISFPGQVYATKRWSRATHIPEGLSNPTRNWAVPHEKECRERIKRASMKIRIGSQDIRPSIATVSQRNTEPHVIRRDSSHEANRRLHSKRVGCSYTGTTPGEMSRVPPASLRQPEAPIQVVYSSSIIQAPAPRRNDNFQVLRWSPPSSNDPGSMRVEVGGSMHPLLPSQESEDKRWKDWVLCDDPAALQPNTPSTEMHTECSGSSILTLPSHMQLRLPSLHLSSEGDLIPGCSSFEQIVEDANLDKKRSRESIDEPHQCDRRCTTQEKPNRLDDLNDTWMKFAYGDEEEDSEELLANMFNRAAHQAAMDMRPSDTSSSLDEHTGTMATCGTERSSLDRQPEPERSLPEPATGICTVLSETKCLEIAPSNMATIASSDISLRKPVQFTVPKAFIGKYVPTDLDSTFEVGVNNSILSIKKTGRKRKRVAMDGRTNIRGLPDFDGDPIEEIEDD